MRLAGYLKGEALDDVEGILAVQEAASIAFKAYRLHVQTASETTEA